MARPDQRPVLNIWSWVSAPGEIKEAYAGKRGPKPQTLRDHMICVAIGLCACEMRVAAGLNTYEASAKLGISQPQLSYYENGRDSFRLCMLLELAELYDRNVNEFFEIINKIDNTNSGF